MAQEKIPAINAKQRYICDWCGAVEEVEENYNANTPRPDGWSKLCLHKADRPGLDEYKDLCDNCCRTAFKSVEQKVDLEKALEATRAEWKKCVKDRAELIADLDRLQSEGPFPTKDEFMAAMRSLMDRGFLMA